MARKQVSVILPVYNRQNLGERAARSVLAQDFDDLELVIVDDCSSPAFVLPADMQNDARVLLVRHDVNQGAGAARNTAIENSTGKYVAFIDSDDCWRPAKISTQLAFATLHDAKLGGKPAAYVCGFALTSSLTGRKQLLQPIGCDNLVDFASGCWFCPGSTALLQRKFFDQVGDYDNALRRLEDLDWFIRFAIAGGALYSVPGIFVDIDAGRKPASGLARKTNLYLINKYARKNAPAMSPNPVTPLDALATRHLKSYLALEQASSHAASREVFGLLWQMAISFALKPRLRLHLKNWWSHPKQ